MLQFLCEYNELIDIFVCKNIIFLFNEWYDNPVSILLMNFDGLVIYYTGLVMFWLMKTQIRFIKLYFGYLFWPSSGGIYLFLSSIINLKCKFF
jgi:hypothetical protein